MNIWLILAILGLIIWLFSRTNTGDSQSSSTSSHRKHSNQIIQKSTSAYSSPSSTVHREKTKAPSESLTNSRNTYNYEIVGESYRRENLLEIINHHNALENGKLYIEALLEPEPTNSYDKNAVMVVIEGKHVGYIPQVDSQRVSIIIKNSGHANMKVKAKIGWDKSLASPIIGVKISLDR